MYHLGTQRIGASIVGNTTPAIVRYISSDRRNTNRATNDAITVMTMTTGIVVTIGTGTTIMIMDTRTDALTGSRAARIGDALAIERAPDISERRESSVFLSALAGGPRPSDISLRVSKYGSMLGRSG